jgi:hypothetical protein
MVVYWKGELGPEAEAAIKQAGVRGVRVNVVSVPYSYDELREIAGPLADALADEGIELDGYRIGDPFDEIAVWGSDLDESGESRSIAERTAAAILPANVSFSIVASPGDFIAADSRHADGGQPTPGNGFEIGSLQVGNYVPVCSSALGWEDPGFRFYMESAAHCVDFANNETAQFDGNSYNAGTYSGYIGTLVGNPNSIGNLETQLDATLIGVPATPSIAGEMFYGSNTSSGKHDIPSIGVVPLNTTLCTNGAATGTHCRAERTSTAVPRVHLCEDFICRYVDVIQVFSTDGTLILGQGDSGGNVFRISDFRVVATVSAISANSYPCGSLSYWSDFNACTNDWGYVTSVTSVATELAKQNPNLVPRLRP